MLQNKGQKIITHEDYFRKPYMDFIAGRYRQSKGGKLPPVPQAAGLPVALAYINHGRWVVECPLGCGDAKLVTDVMPRRYICTDAMCPGDGWYHVRMPAARAEIEAELLKRPARRPDVAVTRNWLPGETVDDLKDQNRARGID